MTKERLDELERDVKAYLAYCEYFKIETGHGFSYGGKILELLAENARLATENRILSDAAANGTRKINDANERIVEFERIKGEMAREIERLAAQLEDAKAAMEEALSSLENWDSFRAQMMIKFLAESLERMKRE